jgi:hypothetical protein
VRRSALSQYPHHLITAWLSLATDARSLLETASVSTAARCGVQGGWLRPPGAKLEWRVGEIYSCCRSERRGALQQQQSARLLPAPARCLVVASKKSRDQLLLHHWELALPVRLPPAAQTTGRPERGPYECPPWCSRCARRTHGALPPPPRPSFVARSGTLSNFMLRTYTHMHHGTPHHRHEGESSAAGNVVFARQVISPVGADPLPRCPAAPRA